MTGGRTVSANPEVLILGGGPAGAAAARLLAKWGHEVVVVERAAGGGGRQSAGGGRNAEGKPGSPGELREGAAAGQSLAESLPPSTRKVLAATGLLGVVEAGDFLPNRGNTALWDGEGRRDDFARGATGFHVERSRFDALLRGAAVGAGAGVVRGIARLPQRPLDDDGWRVEVVRGEGDVRTMRARWVLDCTGRTGVIARRCRLLESAAPTLALVRRYRSESGWDNVESAHALVESFSGGWAWSVPTSERKRHIALMLDPSLTTLGGDGSGSATDLARAFAAGIAETSLMRSVAEAAGPLSDPWALTASMYSSSRYALDGALLVGDAASFIDPMSSFGVKKALASAWLAAITVHTALRDPERITLATDFYNEREDRIYRSLRGELATQVEDSAHATADFWERRRRWLADAPDTASEANAPEGPDAAALRDDPEVRSAFHALRLGSGRLRPATRRTVEIPAVIGNRIRPVPALATPRFPRGVRFFRDVDLLRVVHLAAGAPNPGALYESYSEWAAREDLPPVDLANFIGVAALLIADGVLKPGADG